MPPSWAWLLVLPPDTTNAARDDQRTVACTHHTSTRAHLASPDHTSHQPSWARVGCECRTGAADGGGGDDAGDGEGGGVVGDGGFEGGGVVESSGRVQGGGGLVASRRKAPVQCTEKDVILSRQAARRGEACASQLASSGVRAHGGARTHLP
jgi:hypothetical protein